MALQKIIVNATIGILLIKKTLLILFGAIRNNQKNKIMTNNLIQNNRVEHLATKPISRPEKPIPTSTPLSLKFVRFGFNTIGRVFPEKASQIALKLFGTPRIRARHKVSDDLIDGAKKSSILVNNLKIKTYQWGEGDKTILLVHGWESRGTALRTFVPDIIKAGFKVIAFDAPAHGDSEGKHATLLTFSEVIAAIINQDGNIHSIIAHSFGGPSTIYAISNMNLKQTIQKVVLVATPSKISVPVNQAIDLLNLSPKTTIKFVQKIEDILNIPIEKLTVANLAKNVDIKEILIVHDKKDKMVSIDSAMAHFEAFKQSHLITTEGLGHYLIMKDKKIINRITRFVTVP